MFEIANTLTGPLESACTLFVVFLLVIVVVDIITIIAACGRKK